MRATGAMVIATLLWGATFVVLRDALHRLDPAALVFCRFAAAAIVFAPLMAARARALDRTVLLGGLLSGACTAAGYLFQAIGLTEISTGSSAFLTSTGTLLAGLFAWPLLGQRPGALLAVGLMTASAGSALLAGRNALSLGAGEAWALLGAVAYGLQIVVVARVAPRVDAMALAGGQALVVALALAPAGAPHLDRLARLPVGDLWRLGYLAIAGSVVAPLLQICAQRTLPAGRVGLLFALEPVFALVFATAVAAERFPFRWWAGAGLILCAVVMVEGRGAWPGGSRRASA
jgi:drug/metabolite transporter (DMT)-like permease